MHGNIYRDTSGKRRCSIPDAGITFVPSSDQVRVYRSVHEEEDKRGSHVGNVDVPKELIDAAEQCIADQERILEICRADSRLLGMFRYELEFD